MKRNVFLLILSLGALFAVMLTGCASDSPRMNSAELSVYQEAYANNILTIDFQDAESFEAALNAGEDTTGKVVTFTPTEIRPRSAVGYNIWAGEHLNFVSDEDLGINAGDTITVVIVKAAEKAGSWFIHYELLSGITTASDSTSDTTEFIESTAATNTPADVNEYDSSTTISNDAAGISEQVIYEGNDVVIKATGLETTSSGVTLKVYIENNSNLNLCFTAHSYAVNGVMTRNNIYDMYCDVAAGKKANTSIEIPASILNEFDIDKVKNIDILFWAYDNDKSYKSFETDVIHISTSLDDGTESLILGENIYESNGIHVDYLESDGDNFIFVLTNTTGCYFDFDIENLSINDFTTSDVDFDLYDVEVLNDCQYVFIVTPSSDFKSENAITDVQKIEFSINYRPLGDYFNEESTDMMGYTF